MNHNELIQRYKSWSTEDLARAASLDREKFIPEALAMIEKELFLRGVSVDSRVHTNQGIPNESMLSINKFDFLAARILDLIIRLLHDGSIIESIIENYSRFCAGDEARRLNITQMDISDEIRLRLRFECICFCIFLVTLQSSKYLTERKWFHKIANPNLNQMFHGALGLALIKYCKKSGLTSLREIQLVSILPKLEFGFGDYLDPIVRLDEYGAIFRKKRGRELINFGKRLGMVLDAEHYHLLEIIGMELGKPMDLVAYYALTKVFKK